MWFLESWVCEILVVQDESSIFSYLTWMDTMKGCKNGIYKSFEDMNLRFLNLRVGINFLSVLV